MIASREKTVLDAAIQRYVERNPTSLDIHKRALDYLPGGNTRTTLYSPPFPVSMKRGQGYQLYDEDGHEYVDLVGELTAGLYGHSHPKLQEALITACREVGLSLGATNVHEQVYASLLCRRFRLGHIRFTNSGTEANIHCLAAARRFTGRDKVVVYRGGYHGSVLAFGTGMAANNIDKHNWIVLQYNSVAETREAFAKHDDIAAVLVEGVQGSAGSIPASKEFLGTIQELCQKRGALFILDEVMTSRLAPGGLAELWQLKPDMVTLGKYLGGGMPFGAFGGRKEVMAVYDPRNPASLAHSGTFQNNTMMLIAGHAGLSSVYTPELAVTFNKQGDLLRQRLNQVFKGTVFTVTGVGSLMCIHATTTGLGPEQIRCKDDWDAAEASSLKVVFWLEMLEAGFWFHRRGSIALNIELPTAALDSFIDAAKGFIERHQDLVLVPDESWAR